MVELTAGAQVGPYQLEGEIGRGGMARVFRARQASLNRTIALKILSPELGRDGEFVTRFRREALIAAALEHPNIVPIYDVGESNGQLYLAMRDVRGRSLAEALRRDGAFRLDRAQRIVAQIANALDYAHSRGVVHRDLKPANILVEPNDHASLVDFGIARAGDGTQLTRVGQIAGTPRYMLPEQIQGQPADYRSDLYALGVLVYELLSGRLPFDADSDVAVLHKHVYEPPPPLRTLRPDLPAWVERAVMRMLAKRPEDRFPSAGAFAAALGDPTWSSSTGSGARNGRGGLLLWAPAAAAAVVLGVVAVVMLQPGPATRPASPPEVAGATAVPIASATALPKPANTPVPQAADARTECARRMESVDALWDKDWGAAVTRLQDIALWDAACGDAPNKLYAARVNLAQSLLRGDRAADALAVLRQAIQANPAGGEAVVLERLTAAFVAGQQAYAGANWPEAIDQLKRVHDERPGFDDGKADALLFDAFVNDGNSLAGAQQWPQACGRYSAAAALRPDDASIQQPRTNCDVLDAITRANNAWTAGRASLNPADLAVGMAGQELREDTALLNQLRQQGRYIISHEVSFAATKFTSSGPEHVVVDTRETWYDEIYDLATRRMIQREQAKSYSETYTVERINARWIVTLIQVH